MYNKPNNWKDTKEINRNIHGAHRLLFIAFDTINYEYLWNGILENQEIQKKNYKYN